MPCVGLAGEAGRTMTIKRIPFQITGADLGAIKAMWSGFVLRLAHRLAGAHGTRLPIAVVAQLGRGDGVMNYRFRTSGKKKRHAIRYSMRSFPAWASALPGALNSYQRFGLAAGNPMFSATIQDRLPRGQLGPRPKPRRLNEAEKLRYKSDVNRWRAEVRGQLPEAQPVLCLCCDDPKPCDFYDSIHMGASWYQLAYGHLHLLLDADADDDG